MKPNCTKQGILATSPFLPTAITLASIKYCTKYSALLQGYYTN